MNSLHQCLEIVIGPDRIAITAMDDYDNRIGDVVGMAIDRLTNTISAIPPGFEITSMYVGGGAVVRRKIYGILGVHRLVSGPYLIVVTERREIGCIVGHKIYELVKAEFIPFARTETHLTEKESVANKQFLGMLEDVLNWQPHHYFSYTHDLTHTTQRMTRFSKEFQTTAMASRADERFLWNRYTLSELLPDRELHRFCLPIVHGFVGIRHCVIGESRFQLAVISRRSAQRAGTRFTRRGLNLAGQPANYVETEQIIESLDANSYICAHVQLRGSIPLLWSQRPNLRWMPTPKLLAPRQQQVETFSRHIQEQQLAYQNAQFVIVDLINQKGNELLVGDELRQVFQAAHLPNLTYYAFDFHKHCKKMNWKNLDILKGELRPLITSFGFYGRRQDNAERSQQGYFRTNCMDCLDRTNVTQSIIAREVLLDQLKWLHIVSPESTTLMDVSAELETTFKNIWADNGDACSVQYAGTGALKADFTRTGARTMSGAMRDGVNAVTRYFRNNFLDAYRQDAIDLFLGFYSVRRDSLPPLDIGIMTKWDWHTYIALAALFSAAMAVLSATVGSELAYQWFFFWLLVTCVCLSVIFVNGEDFVNIPKLHQD